MRNIVNISSKVNMCIYDEVKWFILFDALSECKLYGLIIFGQTFDRREC